MHKKILEKAASKLKKDASKYHKEASHAKGKKKMHEKVEEKEAKGAASRLKKMSKRMHEY